MEHICPYCGSPNLDYATHCIKCEKQINPISIEDFDTLFSDYNGNLLKNAHISDGDYKDMVSNLFMRADYMEIYGDTIKNKILKFASVFAECKPKSKGYERGYIFLGNGIHYDDRLDDSVQIATIIHELAHFLLFSIIERLLCRIFHVKSSIILKSFIWYFLTLPEFKIMNEFCAHTVEGRFIPFGYQNYGSYNMLIRSIEIDQQSLDVMVVFGNTFADEIISYLETYIDEDLREEIKIQYKKDLEPPSYESILSETSDAFSLDLKNRTLIGVLYNVFEEASKEGVRKELDDIKRTIELS